MALAKLNTNGTLSPMRNIIFLLCIITLFAVGVSSASHAELPSSDCSHHIEDISTSDQDCVDEPLQDQSDEADCQECCFMHNHVMTLSIVHFERLHNIKDVHDIDLYNSLYSHEISPLYRPPIV